MRYEGIREKLIGYVAQAVHVVARLYRFLSHSHAKAVKCVVAHEGKVLLVRHTYGQPRWTLPGGYMRKREDPTETALREMAEEVGVRLREAKRIGEYGALTICAAESAGRFIQADGKEILKAMWVSPGALPEVCPRTRPILSLWKRKKEAVEGYGKQVVI